MGEVSELRKEILSMQSFELAKQVEIAEHFDVVLTKLCGTPGVNKRGRQASQWGPTVLLNTCRSYRQNPRQGQSMADLLHIVSVQQPSCISWAQIPRSCCTRPEIKLL